MLSKLCVARKCSTLPPKKTFQSFAPICHACTSSDVDNVKSTVTARSSHCHLLQCSFCENRYCSLECPCQDNEERDRLAPSDSCVRSTDNPAYGLSSKIWLEHQDMEPSIIKVNNMRRKEIKTDVSAGVKKPGGMNYVNISSSFLESIPESREMVTCQTNSSRDSQKADKPHTEDPNTNNTPMVTPFHRKANSENKSFNSICDDFRTGKKNCDKSCDRSTEYANQLASDTNSLKVLNVKQKCAQKDKALSSADDHRRTSERGQMDLTSHAFSQRAKNEGSRFRRLPQRVKNEYIFGHSKPCAESENQNNLKKRSNVLGHDNLSEITSVNTEESIQEWLIRISEWVDSNSWIKDNCEDEDSDDQVKYSDSEDSYARNNSSLKRDTMRPQLDILDKNTDEHNSEQSDSQPKEASVNASQALQEATKESPVKIPMVVMQCSRIHSHITSKPPFQQSSLPMGTLVTALYQESDWLYVQTPHGVEGFISAANCIPIGAMRTSNQSKRPWEPCDFPIETRIRNTCDFGRQHAMFVPTKLPMYGRGKQPAPFVNVVKMKTSFYSDRYFNNTFKHRDPIKTAKTVTDILRSSPEIEINKQ